MIKIIPLTKERLKKLSIFGADVSIGFAKYVELIPKSKYFPEDLWEKVNFLFDHNEEDGIITHRFILWRFKLEVKTMVQYDFKFA